MEQINEVKGELAEKHSLFFNERGEFMNIIKVNVNFKNRTIYKQGVNLTTGDYNSTKLVFEFDRQDGRKVFEMKDPDGDLVLLTDIVNDEVELVGKDENGNNASLFKQEGKYIFEISLYDGDSKLTSAFDYIKVRQEQIQIDGEVITPYLPIFDELVNEVENIKNAIKTDGNGTKYLSDDGTYKFVQGGTGEGTIKDVRVDGVSVVTDGVANIELSGLEKTLQDILAIIQGGELNENQVSQIEQLIVSYFENKTVEEVER